MAVVSKYYFDGHTAITDPNNVWNNESNIIDGYYDTFGTTNTGGSTSSNYILIEGTNAPSDGRTIHEVSARYYGGRLFPGDSLTVNIYTDGLGELLYSNSNTTVSWQNYITLTTPTGGWTWAKLQELEVKAYCTLVDTGAQLGIIELVVNPTAKTSLYLVQGFQ